MDFLKKNKEKAEFNQYWFSSKTIDFIKEEIINQKVLKIAFLSVPSVYFSLENRENAYIFEIDPKFKSEPNYIYFDFNQPDLIPKEYNNFFDFIVIDPPFITKDVWSKYAETAKKIMKIDSKILLCSIEENKDMLFTLLNVQKRVYKPCIPHLVYQYNFFSNYESDKLNEINPEIGF